MTYPTFTNGQVLPASDLNAIGLWLVKSQTVGAGVTSVNVTSCFTADYDSYKIVYDGGVASTFVTCSINLGASATGYYMSLPYVTYGSGVASGTSLSNATAFALCGAGDTNYIGVDLDVLGPNLARYTRVQGAYIANNESGSYTGIHKVATAYTGFTLSIIGGNATGGTISVYGYRK
jgi:hypothetical protein